MFGHVHMEYRVVFHWGRDHWTCVTTGDMPVDIYNYIRKNLAEMQDVIDDDPAENYFSVKCYAYGNELVQVWSGTPEELMKAFKETSDEWLSHAFE